MGRTTYEPLYGHRLSARLLDYDYGAEGVYFVTICTWSRYPVLGICNGSVTLNAIGTMVEQEWLRTAKLRARLGLDAYVVMPDHLHGLLVIGASIQKPIAEIVGDGYFVDKEDAGHPPSQAVSLGAVVRGFKGATTSQTRRIAGPQTRLWQRGFYEHVVRDMNELETIREYISENPLRWAEDADDLSPVYLAAEREKRMATATMDVRGIRQRNWDEDMKGACHAAPAVLLQKG